MASKMYGPVIFADEVGYLGNARFLSGISHMPDMLTCTFYHFGYSLFLIPSFVLFKNPEHIYQCALWTNSIIITAAFVLMYYFLRSIFKLSSKNAMVIAFTTSCYPAFFLQSVFAWVECLFITAFIACIIFLYQMLKHKNLKWNFIFGITCSFLYTIHPRASVVVLLGIILYIVLFILKIQNIKNTIVGLLSILSVLILTNIINGIIIDAGYSYTNTHNYLNIFNGIVASILNTKGILRFLTEIIGQFWYLSVSSYGLFILGLIIIIQCIFSIRKKGLKGNDELALFVTLIFLLLSGIFILISSSILMQKLDSEGRVDRLIFGRYNEGFLPLFICIGLTFFVKEKNSQYKNASFCIMIPLLISIAGFTLVLVYGSEVLSGSFNFLNAFGIYHWIRILKGLDVGTVSLIAILIFLIACIFKRKIPLLVFLMFISVFSFSIYKNFKYHKRTLNRSGKNIKSVYKKLKNFGDLKQISYDMSSYCPQTLFGLQYWLMDTKFERFNSSLGEIPSSDIILGGDRFMKGASGFYQKTNLGYGLALWSLSKNVEVPDTVNFEPIVIKASELYSKVGKVKGTRRIAQEKDDEPGFLIYGPYIESPSGEYEVNLEYSSADTTDLIIGKWSITLNRGKVLIKEGELPIASEKGRFTTRFSVPLICHNSLMEFRVWYNGSGTLIIDEVSIERIGK